MEGFVPLDSDVTRTSGGPSVAAVGGDTVSTPQTRRRVLRTGPSGVMLPGILIVSIVKSRRK